MKIFLFTVIIFSLVTLFHQSTVFAQDNVLSIENDSINAGLIKKNAVKEVIYKVTNLTGNEYKIYSVSSSCGCTVPKYPESIKPKQQIEIKAIFNSKGYTGKVQKELVLVTDTPDKYYKLMFFANVE